MTIVDLLAPGGVLELTGGSAEEILAELAAPVAQAHRLDPAQLAAALAERERLGSTGVGDGVAIPHARIAGIPTLAACLGRSRGGIDYQALDGKPARLFLALFAPEASAGLHLQALARASRIFKSSSFRDRALEAPDPEALRRLLAEEEARL